MLPAGENSRLSLNDVASDVLWEIVVSNFEFPKRVTGDAEGTSLMALRHRGESLPKTRGRGGYLTFLILLTVLVTASLIYGPGFTRSKVSVIVAVNRKELA
jgi:hypothetical protein